MSRTLQSLEEAERYLLQYSPLKVGGEAYTLGRMQVIMERLGNPQNQLHIIHVAGTSGKTSTAYFIRNLLEAAGKRTGLTASPHIETITERVQVEGNPLDEARFLSYLNEFLTIIAAWPELAPSYFELLIALSYWTFAKEKVDYAVIETGLGGLKDATNVVQREDKICVLTPIGLDHTQILGGTQEEIAHQKAGIISDGNKVFSAEQLANVREVFETEAATHAATVEYVSISESDDTHMPQFQQQNWQLALRVYDFMRHRDDLPPLSRKELSTAQQPPPGRYERYHINGKTIILDGAHNPQKLQALRAAIRNETTEHVAVLAAFIAAPEVKIERCLDELQQLAHSVIMTEFSLSQDIKARQSVRLAEFEKLRYDLKITTRLSKNPEAALTELLQSDEKTLVITGSLYLVALVRPILRDYAAKQLAAA